MGVFYQEDPPNPSRKCFLAGALKDAFCNCHTFSKPLPNSNNEDEYPTSDFDDEEEVLTNLFSHINRYSNLLFSMSYYMKSVSKFSIYFSGNCIRNQKSSNGKVETKD